MQLHRRALLATAVALTLSVAVDAGEIRFKNGDRLTGVVTTAADGKLTIESAVAGKITVPMDQLATFTTDEPVDIVLKDGSLVRQSVSAGEQEGTIATISDSAAAQPLPLSEVVAINPPPIATPWTGSILGGLNGSNGNSKTFNATVAATASKRGINDRVNLGGVYNYGETTDTDTGQNNVNTDQWRISGQYDYFLTEKWYLYGRTAFEQDNVADLQMRITPGVGLGYQWWERPESNFTTEGGLTYVYENYNPGDVNNFVAARLAYRYDRKITDKFTIFNNVEYIPSLEDASDFLINADIGAKVLLTEKLFAEARFEWAHDSSPAPGKGPNDQRYIVGVGWQF